MWGSHPLRVVDDELWRSCSVIVAAQLAENGYRAVPLNFVRAKRDE
jgi:hypothetical protein